MHNGFYTNTNGTIVILTLVSLHIKSKYNRGNRID
jgi:hypothetical protein